LIAPIKCLGVTLNRVLLGEEEI